MSGDPVVYQVSLEIAHEYVAEFDEWLPGHIARMLQFSGFKSADVAVPDCEPGPGAWPRRVVRYHVASRADLDRYLSEDAEVMRAEGLRRFGRGLRAEREVHVLRHDQQARGEDEETRHCQNCGVALIGQYCGQCGQRDSHRMISVWELMRDSVEDVLSMDSRMWRTLLPLLTRPGQLTVAYLRGRRVHYTPPLRMYVLLSILFFLLMSFDADLFRFQVDDEEAQATSEALSDLGLDEAASNDESGGTVCAPEKFNINVSWLDEEAARARAVHICERLTTSEGRRAFLNALADNTPAMLLVFLPIIAFVQKLLYLGSRRYYVEHLLFFVHFHSFVFLVLTVTTLIGRIPEWFAWQGAIAGATDFVASAYIPYYLFRSLRVVYGQTRGITAVKYVVLFFAYVLGLALIFLLGSLITLLTV